MAYWVGPNQHSDQQVKLAVISQMMDLNKNNKNKDISQASVAGKARSYIKRKSSIRSKKLDAKEFHSDVHLEVRLDQISQSEIVSPEIQEIESVNQRSAVVSQFNALRTKQLIIIVLLTIAVAFINNLVNQHSEITSKVLSMAALVFIGCYLLVQRGKVRLGGFILLWSLYITITALMVSNEGLRDPVGIGYTGILIFAAMLGNKRQFLVLTLVMASSFFAVGYANDLGWLDYSTLPFGWGTVIDYFLIYSVISYTVWTLANDLRFALSSLEVENLRVNQSKQEYQRIAHYDYLTGLPNRIIAVDRFNQAIFHSHLNAEKVAVLFVDLDNFKTVNDSLGHTIGDKLLQEIARRLLSSVRDIDTVCRLGGDEFLILLDGIHDDTSVNRISSHILSCISKPIVIEEHNLTTTCSIGIALSPTDGEDFDLLRKKADMAMYKAKDSGRNAFMFFDQRMNKDRLTHIDRVNSLRNAISKQEFVLHYQPKVDLSSGKVFSAEALIRWQPPGMPMVMPDEFIPIAESTGIIIEIGEWVLYEACRQCKEFQRKGLADFSIAVNLSSIQFRRGNLARLVKEALAAADLSASYLELEVTESLLVEDTDDIHQQINELQKCGVTFSIDDFGTGYSSLSYLRDFSFDFLKIDRTFVKNSSDNGNDLALCEAMVVMAHKLKLMVTAEGIETLEQKEAMFAAGCEFGQGIYFSPPLPVEDFFKLKELKLTPVSEQFIIGEPVGSMV